jgi:origin recognition complex subunit 4
MHAQTAGHEVVTFEMLHETFRDQVRSSTSAPVEVEGGGIGMVRCTRNVLKSVRVLAFFGHPFLFVFFLLIK